MVVVVVEDKYIRNGSPYPQEQEADGYKEQFYVCLGGCQNVTVLCYAGLQNGTTIDACETHYYKGS